MNAPVLTRIGLTVAVALVCAGVFATLASLSSQARGGGAAALAPDLVTLAFGDEDMLIAVEEGKTLLRISNEVSNRGAGPLEVFPSVASQNCDGDGDATNDRDASQRTYADTDGSGLFERSIDGVDSERQFGCLRYHPLHDHWHVLDFAEYQLRSEPGGELAALTRKVGFCLGDNRLAFSGPTTPPTGTYPLNSGLEMGCDAAATQGLSVGYADIYPFYLAGQQLRISRLPPGRYCLISRVDPDDLLAETDETNNVRRTPIQLRPRKLSVRRLAGGCQQK